MLSTRLDTEERRRELDTVGAVPPLYIHPVILWVSQEVFQEVFLYSPCITLNPAVSEELPITGAF